ncbi:MAG: hypothetical protein GEU91_12840 [Rhizobiales bacterium]|nr:hypothetical protein [Hyphomicrobiales bacterium]
MLTAKLDEDHKKLVSRNIRQEFSRFWDVVVEDGGAEFFKFLYPLFFRVYELSFEQRFLTKTEAMDYVLLRHAGTFKKYVEAAAARGFFDFVENPADRRETLIKSGPELARFVEHEIDKSYRALMDLASAWGDYKVVTRMPGISRPLDREAEAS